MGNGNTVNQLTGFVVPQPLAAGPIEQRHQPVGGAGDDACAVGRDRHGLDIVIQTALQQSLARAAIDGDVAIVRADHHARVIARPVNCDAGDTDAEIFLPDQLTPAIEDVEGAIIGGGGDQRAVVGDRGVVHRPAGFELPQRFPRFIQQVDVAVFGCNGGPAAVGRDIHAQDTVGRWELPRRLAVRSKGARQVIARAQDDALAVRRH